MVNSNNRTNTPKSTSARSNRRGGQNSRSRMRAKRTAKPRVSAAPTGQVGGDRVYFGTGGAAVQTLDSSLNQGRGGYRPSTLEDL